MYRHLMHQGEPVQMNYYCCWDYLLHHCSYYCRYSFLPKTKLRCEGYSTLFVRLRPHIYQYHHYQSSKHRSQWNVRPYRLLDLIVSMQLVLMPAYSNMCHLLQTMGPVFLPQQLFLQENYCSGARLTVVVALSGNVLDLRTSKSTRDVVVVVLSSS